MDADAMTAISIRDQVLQVLLGPDGQRLSFRQIDKLTGASMGTASKLHRQLTGRRPDAKKSKAAQVGNAARHGREFVPLVSIGETRQAAARRRLIAHAKYLGLDPDLAVTEPDQAEVASPPPAPPDPDPWRTVAAILGQLGSALDEAAGAKPAIGTRVPMIDALEKSAAALLDKSKQLRRLV